MLFLGSEMSLYDQAIAGSLTDWLIWPHNVIVLKLRNLSLCRQICSLPFCSEFHPVPVPLDYGRFFKCLRKYANLVYEKNVLTLPFFFQNFTQVDEIILKFSIRPFSIGLLFFSFNNGLAYFKKLKFLGPSFTS